MAGSFNVPAPGHAGYKAPPPGAGTFSTDADPAGTWTKDASGLPTPNNSLIGPLKLPAGLNATSTFVWDYSTHDAPKNPIYGPPTPGHEGFNQAGQNQTTMTVAGALSWLKSLAVSDKDHYNLVVHQLVAAGYMTPEAARYNSYSIAVGNGFLQSVADVWSINNNPDGKGTTVRWIDHMNDMIQGRKDSGQIDENGLPLSGSGGGSTGPVRQDNWSDPETVKATINNAAKNVLGRELTPAEVAAFAGAFHGQEQSYNDKVWAGQQAAANGGTASMPDRPSVGAAAQNYEESNPAQTQERTTQMLGSYIGVLRNMAGLGSGGVAGAVR